MIIEGINKKLTGNIVALFMLKGIEYVVSFITLPYLLYVLEPDKFGAIVFSQSLIAYGTMIVDFGFNLTAPRDIAQSSAESIARQFSTIWVAKGILLSFCLLIGTIIVYIFREQIDVFLLICVIPTLIGNVIFPVWYYQGVQQMKFITGFNMVARVISVIGIFTLVHDSSDYCLAAFLLSITPFLAGVISLITLLTAHRELFCKPLWHDVYQKYREGWEIFVSTIFINLYTNSNIIILRMLTNDTCVGYYAAASKIIDVLKGGLAPISNAIFPHVSVLVHESRKDAITFLHRVVYIIGAVGLSISILMFLLADSVVQLLMGNAYGDSVQILKIISFLPFIVGLSNVFGIQTMVAFGMQTLFSRILMLSAILNFILVFPMVYWGQAIGMAVTVVIVEFFVTGVMYLMLRKNGIDLI